MNMAEFMKVVEKSNAARAAATKRQAEIMVEFLAASKAGNGILCQTLRDKLHVEVDAALDCVSGVHGLARKHGLKLLG